MSLISPALDPGSTTVEVWLRVENREGHVEGGDAGTGHDYRTHVNERATIPAEAVPTAPYSRRSAVRST